MFQKALWGSGECGQLQYPSLFKYLDEQKRKCVDEIFVSHYKSEIKYRNNVPALLEFPSKRIQEKILNKVSKNQLLDGFNNGCPRMNQIHTELTKLWSALVYRMVALSDMDSTSTPVTNNLGNFDIRRPIYRLHVI